MKYKPSTLGNQCIEGSDVQPSRKKLERAGKCRQRTAHAGYIATLPDRKEDRAYHHWRKSHLRLGFSAVLVKMWAEDLG